MDMIIRVVGILFFVIIISSWTNRLTGHREGTQTDKAANDDYKLVWCDEFEKTGSPDSANWRYENGFVRNEEWQWYQQRHK